MRREYDTLVVGAGFAGAVLAERLAAGRGERVLVIDRRDHIAGNAYDYVDEHGVLCHRYGPHIFHTQSEKVWSYLSRFTEWRPVRAPGAGRGRRAAAPVPDQPHTINGLYGLELRTDGRSRPSTPPAREPRRFIANSEDAVVSRVGRDLYETFFRGYTRKQWGLDPAELSCSVTSRIPVRTKTTTATSRTLPSDAG